MSDESSSTPLVPPNPESHRADVSTDVSIDVSRQTRETAMSRHQPPCPNAKAIDADAAKAIATFPQQGWSLLCNGLILFDDTGELLPDGQAVPPRRGPAPHNTNRQLASKPNHRNASQPWPGKPMASAATG
jgi:hypothetical protein